MVTAQDQEAGRRMTSDLNAIIEKLRHVLRRAYGIGPEDAGRFHWRLPVTVQCITQSYLVGCDEPATGEEPPDDDRPFRLLPSRRAVTPIPESAVVLSLTFQFPLEWIPTWETAVNRSRRRVA